MKMRFRLIWRGILFDALTLLVKEKRGAGDLDRLSGLSCMLATISGVKKPRQKRAWHGKGSER